MTPVTMTLTLQLRVVLDGVIQRVDSVSEPCVGASKSEQVCWCEQVLLVRARVNFAKQCLALVRASLRLDLGG